MKRRLAALLLVAAVGWPACERTAVAAGTAEPQGVLGESDALVLVAIITFIVAPIITAAIASWRSRKRAGRLAAEFKAVRLENTEQHAAGQQILRALVDSQHMVVGKLDEIAVDVADLKQSAHTHPQPEGDT